MQINMNELECIISKTGDTKTSSENMQTFQHMSMDDVIDHMEETYTALHVNTIFNSSVLGDHQFGEDGPATSMSGMSRLKKLFSSSNSTEVVCEILILCGFSKTTLEGIEYYQASKEDKETVQQCKKIFKAFQQLVDAQVDYSR